MNDVNIARAHWCDQWHTWLDISTDLSAQAKSDQHAEEEDGPERRDGQSRHNFWVDDERQASSCK